MKKKIAVISLLIIIPVLLCACNTNMKIIDTTWNFRWAIIQLGNGELLEGEVTSWLDFKDSDCVQFTMNGITYLTHYSNVILCTEEP